MRIQNYAGIFRIFSHDEPDRTGAMLQKIGIVSFGVTFYALLVAVLVGRVAGEDSVPFNSLAWVAVFGWVVGIFAFIAAGTHYVGKANNKKNFLGSMLYVISRTFLYVLLPSAVIAALFIVWAIVTKQPAFN